MAFAIVVVAAALAGGCETFLPHFCDRSDEDNPWLVFDGGTTTYEASDGGAPVAVKYDSRPADGELLLYKGGMRYRLIHHLGRTPGTVSVALSYDEYVTAADGSFAQAAGDQALYNADDAGIDVVNNSCVDYFLRVTAE
jgi:hypothetical protein